VAAVAGDGNDGVEGQGRAVEENVLHDGKLDAKTPRR
jgi:hypothetical protein